MRNTTTRKTHFQAQRNSCNNSTVSARRRWNPRERRVSPGYRRPNNDQSRHNTDSKLVTKTARVLLRTDSLYWEHWLRTRGSLCDATTHAGRCSPSIMRHFITERQPWHQSSLRDTFRTEGLPLLDSCGGNLLLLHLSQSFFLWRRTLPARSKWTSVSSKLPSIHLMWRIKEGSAPLLERTPLRCAHRRKSWAQRWDLGS